MASQPRNQGKNSKTRRSKPAKDSGSKKTNKKTALSTGRSPKSSNIRHVQAEIVDPSTKPAPEDLSEELHAEFDPAAADPLSLSDANEVRASRLPVVSDASSVEPTAADPVQTYLAEIRKYPLLSKEEEYDLAVRYHETRDAKAAERLVTANLRFVVKIATEYSKFGAKLIDLIQEGNVGLMHAVREFNPYKNVRLITYAVWWIRGYIQEYLMRQYSMVRIGTTQNQRKLFYRLQKEKEKLDQMGLEPTLPLLSSRLGVPEDEVKEMQQRMSGRDVSLDQPLDTDSGLSRLDFESREESSIDERLSQSEDLEILRASIEKLRPELNEKELYLLENRLLADEPMTLQEIGDHYGVTREAVRQLETRLLKRIREQIADPATK